MIYFAKKFHVHCLFMISQPLCHEQSLSFAQQIFIKYLLYERYIPNSLFSFATWISTTHFKISMRSTEILMFPTNLFQSSQITETPDFQLLRPKLWNQPWLLSFPHSTFYLPENHTGYTFKICPESDHFSPCCLFRPIISLINVINS